MAGDFEELTRNIFHEIHVAQADNAAQVARTLEGSALAHLGVPAEFFVGKVCLEAGCGSYAPGSLNMLRAGAQHVTAMDLNETIFELTAKTLAEFPDRHHLQVASVLDIPFDDGHFDFALCDGVLHHCADPLAGLAEVCRVVKPGGSVYVSVYGQGGLMKQVTTVVRTLYRDDPSWRTFIDGLTPELFIEVFRDLAGQMMAAGDSDGAALIREDLVRRLFDQDLILTIFDRIKAPEYFEVSEADMTDAFDRLGFSIKRRLARYPRFTNVRRFMAPLYYRFDSPLAKLMYGDGIIQYFATKG